MIRSACCRAQTDRRRGSPGDTISRENIRENAYFSNIALERPQSVPLRRRSRSKWSKSQFVTNTRSTSWIQFFNWFNSSSETAKRTNRNLKIYQVTRVADSFVEWVMRCPIGKLKITVRTYVLLRSNGSATKWHIWFDWRRFLRFFHKFLILQLQIQTKQILDAKVKDKIKITSSPQLTSLSYPRLAQQET